MAAVFYGSNEGAGVALASGSLSSLMNRPLGRPADHLPTEMAEGVGFTYPPLFFLTLPVYWVFFS